MICGQTVIDSASGVSSFQVPDQPSFQLAAGWLTAQSGVPVVLRFADGCETGVDVENASPSVLRLGTTVHGTRSGILAVLVYGLRAGQGTLLVSRGSGARTEVTVPVS